jgi:hypothetical protein
MVRVANRTTSWARKNKFESGESTLFATAGAEIYDDTSELVIPSGSTIQVSYAVSTMASSPMIHCGE